MLRKLIVFAALALNTGVIVSVGSAANQPTGDLPLPHCYPCPKDPKAMPSGDLPLPHCYPCPKDPKIIGR